jgi:HK97 family phage prohead protease
MPLELTAATANLSIRDEAERIITARIVPWDELAETPEGLEQFTRGAFSDVDPTAVVFRQDHHDPALGRGLTLEEREDGAYMEFRLARTAAADELLGLIRDGVYRGASVGFNPLPGFTDTRRHQGRVLNVRRKVDLPEVSAVWRPAFQSAAITNTRSQEEEPMPPEATPAAAPAAPAQDVILERVMTRLDELETRSRQASVSEPPAADGGRPAITLGHWALGAVHGEGLAPEQLRALAEIVTTDNMGVVPDAFRAELLGPIEASRPFLETTRNVPAPSAGIKLQVPRIVSRPPVGVQAAEKDELATGTMEIDSVEYPMVTIGGAGDLSLQLMRRSSPEFLDLYVRLLAEAYSFRSDREALIALLVAGINDGGTFDPEAPTYGTAYTNAVTAMRRPANRVWMSSAAYAVFIDAKEPAGGGGRPLYPGLAGIESVTADGPGGPDRMRLRPVIVPELDVLKASPPAALTGPEPDIEVPDIIIGPADGFAWAEDGTYTLQADNPGQAGRDVALVGMLFYAATHPGAFTGYTL